MARQLKVFRTPIGFHDAYVAASSRKAALEAWGADVDLFARGAAEQVTDPGLMEEPLAQPGRVIRKVRGTMEEHLAALPDAPKPKQSASAVDVKPSRSVKSAPSHKPKPRPSRSALDEAETAIRDADQRFDEERRELAVREAALAKERSALEAAHDRQIRKLDNERVEHEQAYRADVEKWIAEQE